MVDKAFVVGVDDLHELCRELKNYSLSVTGRNVTITQHDGGDGLNDISFAFPIVADFSILSALHKNPESGLQVCLHVYTRREVRQSLHLERGRTSTARFGRRLGEFLESSRGSPNP